MDFTMASETQLGRELGPGINGSTLESLRDIQVTITNLILTNLIVIEDFEVELVLGGTFFDVEGEGLVPDRVFSVLDSLGTLLVVFIEPELNIGIIVASKVFLVEVTGFNNVNSENTTGSRVRGQHF